jgi:hypothetical protein
LVPGPAPRAHLLLLVVSDIHVVAKVREGLRRGRGGEGGRRRRRAQTRGPGRRRCGIGKRSGRRRRVGTSTLGPRLRGGEYGW